MVALPVPSSTPVLPVRQKPTAPLFAHVSRANGRAWPVRLPLGNVRLVLRRQFGIGDSNAR